jgi:L-lactate dehydrogenase complex protein LldF
MLLLNRRDAVKQDLVSNVERWGWAAWKKGMLSRKMEDYFGGKAKNFFMKFLFKKTWGHLREMPKVADKSFTKQWMERNKEE